MQHKIMSIPSSSQEYFSIGSIVKCTTFWDQEIQGEVVQYNHDNRMLALKKSSSSGKADLNNFSFMNLNYVKHIVTIQVIDSPVTAVSPALSASKLQSRFKEETEQKMAVATARSSGVTNDGIRLYLHLSRKFPAQNVSWQQQAILILEEVLIQPPYQLDNCELKSSSKNIQCLSYVKTLVEKYYNEDRLKVNLQGST